MVYGFAQTSRNDMIQMCNFQILYKHYCNIDCKHFHVMHFCGNDICSQCSTNQCKDKIELPAVFKT